MEKEVRKELGIGQNPKRKRYNRGASAKENISANTAEKTEKQSTKNAKKPRATKKPKLKKDDSSDSSSDN